MLVVGAMLISTITVSPSIVSEAAEGSITKGKNTVCTYHGDSGHSCKKAVDEKFTKSRWGSNSQTPQAIQIDLGDVYEIDTIKAYLFAENRKYTYEYYVTMEPAILNDNGGNGNDNFVGENPVVTGLQGVGYGWADPNGDKPIPESEIHSEDYTFEENKPVGRYLTLRVTKCDYIVCIWDIQAFGRKVDANTGDIEDDNAVKPEGDLILEAEEGVLNGACAIRDASGCSNGKYVGYIGEGADNTITWKANVETAGTYTLEAYYLSEKDRTLDIKVNGDEKISMKCPAGVDWDKTVVKCDNAITVKLKKGENTIVIGNDVTASPNLDCVALTLKEAEPDTSEPEEGETKPDEGEKNPEETPDITEPEEGETKPDEGEKNPEETPDKNKTEQENEETQLDGSKENQNENSPVTEQSVSVSKGDVYWYKNLKYKVTKVAKNGKGSVELVATKSKKVKSVTIPSTVKIKGKKYNVTSIGKNAFKNCKKLKKIVIKTTKLNKIGKNAFKGIKNDARIKVPASKLKKYKRIFKGKGQSKKVIITKI